MFVPYLVHQVLNRNRNVEESEDEATPTTMSEVSKKRTVSTENSPESNGVPISSEVTPNNVLLTCQSSGDDVSLQDLIEAEFNSRLSNITDEQSPVDDDRQCMALSLEEDISNCVKIEDSAEKMTSQDIKCDNSVENVADQICSTYNYVAPSVNIKVITKNLIENEKQFSVITESRLGSQSETRIQVPNPTVKISEENNIVKESSPPLVVEEDMDDVTDSTVKHEKPSIKDKLMLGSDEQMAMLFSQTITSPAFTPTDEDFDILQAITREENSIDEFVKIENMCRNESFEQQGGVGEIVSPNQENEQFQTLDLSNGEISPENETQISQESDSCATFNEQIIEVPVLDAPTVEIVLETASPTVDETFVEVPVAPIVDETMADSNINTDCESIDISPSLHAQSVENEIEDTPPLDQNQDLEDASVIENGAEGSESSNQFKMSENTFLVNDRKAHDENYTANNAKFVLHLVNTTTTVETTVSERIENNSSTMTIDNKAQVKKKKTKKSKKDHEKENISVNDVECRKNDPYIEDDLSQVNVRNLKQTYCDQSINGANTVKKSEPVISTGISIKELCRSFGDLTSLPDENGSSTQNTPNSPKSLPDSRAKSMVDLRRLDSEPLYTGVSVKALRASFMNLATNTTSSPVWADTKRKSRPVSAHPPLMRTNSVGGQDSKSSFSKFDALSKKTVLHVRSSDAGKAQEKFNGSSGQIEHSCKACDKQVFQMEQIKAEKSIWHKNCFRCKECNKQLNLDTYQSHEGTVYCKPHFKALFAPKVVEDTQPTKPRKHEMIIRESQPIELPPDVVRASDKPDLGLEELQSLNVKSRFQVFEHANDQQDNSLERTPSNVNVKRSASILSKLARFQAKGMDIGVTDDSLNGIPVEDSSEESEESDDGIEGEDADLIRAQRKSAQKEQPVVFDKLNDLKSKWETGNKLTKEERREERKQEIQTIRSRLFMGKQGKMKEMYQQAVAESESGANVKKQVATEINEQAKSIKERFEKGDVISRDDSASKSAAKDEEMSVFEAGISKKSRSLFLELDANAGKAPQMIPLTPVKSTGDVKKARETFTRHISEEVVRSSDAVDDVQIQTADISSKFKFFETYKAPETGRKAFRITPPRDGVVKQDNSPEREIYRDPDVVRAEETIEDPTVAAKTHTATKMLSIFRQLEEQSAHEPVPSGLKPLKRFTPPPEPQRDESDSEGEDVTEEDDASESEPEHPDIVRAADKPADEFLVQAQNAARAKQLRAKFERWEENEIQREQREQNSSSVNLAEECSEEQIESAKTLRARFESMRETTNQRTEKQPRVKVHRFVEIQANNAEICDICSKRVYPLEKVECDSKIYHKQCFRCLQCNAILRMDSYTLNQGMLYCIPHFKQLFIAKGNYETGFGLDQHKTKWQHLQQTNGTQQTTTH